jgi:hypothetical protein
MGRRARGWRADLVDRAVGDGLLPRAKRRGQRRGDLFSGLAGALGQDVVLSVAQKGDLAGWIWMSADSDSTGASEKMGWGPRRSCAPHLKQYLLWSLPADGSEEQLCTAVD